MKLRPWQIDFANKYLEQQKPRSLLVSAIGTGKTVTAMYTAQKMLELYPEKKIIIVSSSAELRDHWKEVGLGYGLKLTNNINDFDDSIHNGLAINFQRLRQDRIIEPFKEVAANSDCFFIVDESYHLSRDFDNLSSEILSKNKNSKFLFMSSLPLKEKDFDSEFFYNTEYIFEEYSLLCHKPRIEIARFCPSFNILSSLKRKNVNLDNLSSRQFEKLVAELLENDGYEVELMQGSKDGGVDVIAIKNDIILGSFKTLWQAKKYTSNKVGLSVVRELADVRNEHHASKAFIVTSSFLTRDATARISRDQYVLGKVDRNDLNSWIKRTLFGEN